MRINFSSVLADVFSQYTTADELKSAANAMCAQIKEAYEARFKELTPNAKLRQNLRPLRLLLQSLKQSPKG